MIRVDNWLIDSVFQPISDRMAHWTSCYNIAAFLLTGCSLGATAACVLSGSYVIAILTLVFLTPVILHAYLLDQQAPSSTVPTARLIWLFSRIGSIMVTLPVSLAALALIDSTWVQRLDDIAWLLLAPGLYFLACRKQPPMRRVAPSPWVTTEAT